MNKKKTQNSFNQGRKDKKKKVHKPPSKGTSKTKSTIIGTIAGSLISPPAALLGGVLGFFIRRF
jgi:hypothetical protein